jgi:hypothetical protein
MHAPFNNYRPNAQVKNKERSFSNTFKYKEQKEIAGNPYHEFWEEIKSAGKNIMPRSYHTSVVHDKK